MLKKLAIVILLSTAATFAQESASVPADAHHAPATKAKQLTNQEFDAFDLTVNGYLAKNGKKIINGTPVKLPDARSLFIGSVGTGAPGDPGANQ